MNIVICWDENPDDLLLNDILRRLLCSHSVCVLGPPVLLAQISARFEVSEQLSFIERNRKSVIKWADCYLCSSAPAAAMLDVPRYIFALNREVCTPEPNSYDFVISTKPLLKKWPMVFQTAVEVGDDIPAASEYTERIISWVGDNFLSRGVFPAAADCGIDNWQEQLQKEATQRELLIQRRFCATQSCLASCTDMDPDLDWAPFLHQQQALCELSLSGRRGEAIKPYRELRRAVAQFKAKYYLKNTKRADDAGEAFRFLCMSALGQTADLLNELEHSEDPHESLQLYCGHVYWDLGQRVYALDCYKNFLFSSLARRSEVYITDSIENRTTALQRAFSVLSDQDSDETGDRLELVRAFLRFAEKSEEQIVLPETLLIKLEECMSSGEHVEEAAALALLREKMAQDALAEGLASEEETVTGIRRDTPGQEETADEEDDGEDGQKDLCPAGAFERVIVTDRENAGTIDNSVVLLQESDDTEETDKPAARKTPGKDLLVFLGHGFGWRLKKLGTRIGSYFSRFGQYAKKNYPWTRKIVRAFSNGWTDLRRFLNIYTEEEQDVLQFKDIYKDTPCFIIGNGPSLRPDDLERISSKGYVCFASNKIYKIFELTDWRPDYYACIDEDVFFQNLSQILSQIECPMFLHNRMRKGVRRYEQAFQKSIEDVHYCRYRWRSHPRFFPQVANTLSGGSVTFTLIELAWMMGFRDMYIIGCDHYYSSFNGLDKNQTSVASSDKTNQDYFIKNYMKPGEIIRVGNLDRLTEGYVLARNYVLKHGGRIRNATRGGYLEVFERVDLDGLLGDNRVTESD